MYQQYAYIMYLHQLVKLKVPLIYLDLFYVYHALAFLPVFFTIMINVFRYRFYKAENCQLLYPYRIYCNHWDNPACSVLGLR